MIDFFARDKINAYLAKGEYEKLHKFIDKESKKYYLSVAAEALNSYRKQNPEFKGRFLYGILGEDAKDLGKLLISNGFSSYFLENDILTSKLQERGIEIKPELEFGKTSQLPCQSFFINKYRRFLESAVDVETIRQTQVGESKKTGRAVVKMFAQGRTIEHQFSTFEFAFTEHFLGTGHKGDIKYKLCPDNPFYYAESPMGKCLVMGLKTNPK